MSQNRTMSEPPASPASWRGGGWLTLSALLLLALVAHLWLLGARWINPDEGAHLMDGVLLLDGLFPGVDYGARQPFYVLATAAGLELFGVGFVPGRMLALTCTLGAAAILYAIARDLFDAKVALVSVGFFLFLPFSLMLSVNAKTQPLAILLAAGAIWMGMKGMRGRGRTALYFVAAGALCALGFYVRESGLAIVAALVLTLAWRFRRAPGRAVRAAASLTAGFVGACLLMGAVYAGNASAEAAWTSASINPFVFVYGNVRQLADQARRDVTPGLSPVAAEPASPDGTQETAEQPPRVEGAQPFNVTLRGIREGVWLNIVLIVGFVLYPIGVITGRSRREPGEPGESGEPGEPAEPSVAALLPLAWAGSMAAAYLFWALQRGFFRAYFLEISAPLTILAAAALVHSGREFVEGTSRLRMGLGLAFLFAALLVIPAGLDSSPMSRPLYFLVTTVALALIHLLDANDYRRWAPALLGVVVLSVVGFQARPWLPSVLHPVLYALWVAGVLFLVFRAARISWTNSPGTGLSFGAYALIVSALFLTLAESLPTTNLRYDGVWGPRTVRAVADEIRSITGPEDDVLSGAVIWDLQAGRRPFMNLSHPLGLIGQPVDDVAPPIRHRLAERPPSVVVFDGYTERTYLAAVPELRTFVESRYTRTLTIETDTRYPVEVYRLNE